MTTSFEAYQAQAAEAQAQAAAAQEALTALHATIAPAVKLREAQLTLARQQEDEALLTFLQGQDILAFAEPPVAALLHAKGFYLRGWHGEVVRMVEESHSYLSTLGAGWRMDREHEQQYYCFTLCLPAADNLSQERLEHTASLLEKLWEGYGRGDSFTLRFYEGDVYLPRYLKRQAGKWLVTTDPERLRSWHEVVAPSPSLAEVLRQACQAGIYYDPAWDEAHRGAEEAEEDSYYW